MRDVVLTADAYVMRIVYTHLACTNALYGS
jgi:hypothetical protein